MAALYFIWKEIKSFRIAREALTAVFVCSILMNTMLMNNIL